MEKTMKQLLAAFSLIFLTSCIGSNGSYVMENCKKVNNCIKDSYLSYEITIFSDIECKVKIKQDGIEKIAYRISELQGFYEIYSRRKAVCKFFEESK